MLKDSNRAVCRPASCVPEPLTCKRNFHRIDTVRLIEIFLWNRRHTEPSSQRKTTRADPVSSASRGSRHLFFFPLLSFEKSGFSSGVLCPGPSRCWDLRRRATASSSCPRNSWSRWCTRNQSWTSTTWTKPPSAGTNQTCYRHR
jgi:hypothetical protein